jgi:hypothetical protein
MFGISSPRATSGDPNSHRNRGRPLDFGFTWGRLPLAIAEPGALIERAVRLQASDGLTRQEALEVFKILGRERFDRGLAWAREAGRIQAVREQRPDRAGRTRLQVVLYPEDTGGRRGSWYESALDHSAGPADPTGPNEKVS